MMRYRDQENGYLNYLDPPNHPMNKINYFIGVRFGQQVSALHNFNNKF